MRAIQGALIALSSLQIALVYGQLRGIFSRYVTALPTLNTSQVFSCVLYEIFAMISHLNLLRLCFKFFSPLGMIPVIALV